MVTTSRRRSAGFCAAVALLLLVVSGCSDAGSDGGGAGGAAVSSAPAASSPSAAPSAAAPGPSSAASALQGLQEAYASLVRQTLPSVVEIRTSAGLGSGVVFDDQGHIVTNAHVVGTAKTFSVVLPANQQTLSATLVGKYEPDDIAVIQVKGAKDLKPAQFGDSSKLEIGDIVLAMGSPLGLSGSVSNGIVSAVGRTVTEPPEGKSSGATLAGAIQTSASINPGNSGGALVNVAGEVVGLPTLAAVDPQIGQGGSAAPGIGFAINSNTVKDIAGQLIRTGGRVPDPHRAALGVAVTPLVDQSGSPAGAGVQQVQAGGPAGKAGIRAGQAIVEVAGQPTLSPSDLATVLVGLKVGQRVPVVVEQPDGSKRTVQVTLGELGAT